MNELTKAEEQIMQLLWELEKAFVNDVLEHLPEPKPAYNTVSTIIRILEKKGFVAHKAYGKTHQYYPVVSKDQYATFRANYLLGNYFGNSVENLLSFFVKEEKINLSEMDQLLKNFNAEKGKKNK
ncbi:MAG: transcriptional regulator [Flavobacteriales bacterium CG18_big_fil_WC_8_21_14_2_50_32_9]|nr:BlaI/MecI/CopY family transcriptional regulator [Flavobacteriales bacterium]PIQ16084.1 MAG: transcriptional regulator [Flavobacteriales bacterium CG18_big_fil_WC_8_21_14_2_50_32_9]PIZ06675.1 MAG: transcriptional regulator [Flavobacteriales bacterium CG_4_10_14_0_8_um_filter_32_5]PJC61544.1 MAG: transcriptional regulator [Flavobacteriales bacterium CG_4_9_14_0_2_um_filter_32_27]